MGPQEQQAKTGSLLDRLKKGAGNGSAADAASNIAKATVTGKPVEEVMKATTSAIKETGAAKARPVTATTDVVINPRQESRDVAIPKKKLPTHVLYKCSHRPNFGSALPNGDRFKFNNGYLLLDTAKDTDKITSEFIKENAKVWGIEEIK